MRYLYKDDVSTIGSKVSDSVRIQYGGSVNDKNAKDLGPLGARS